MDYDDPAFKEAEQLVPVPTVPSIAVSASMVKAAGEPATSAFFDKDFYQEVMANRFTDGTIGEAPVIPGTGLFMPVASAAWKDKGLFRLDVPKYTAHLCTGCMECAVVCPDAAIPNTVHEIHDLLLTAIRGLDVTEQQKESMSGYVFDLTKLIRDAYRKLPSKDPKPFHEIAARSRGRARAPERHAWSAASRKMVEALALCRWSRPGPSSMPWRRRSRVPAGSIRSTSIPGSAAVAWSASTAAARGAHRAASDLAGSPIAARTSSSS